MFDIRRVTSQFEFSNLESFLFERGLIYSKRYIEIGVNEDCHLTIVY